MSRLRRSGGEAPSPLLSSSLFGRSHSTNPEQVHLDALAAAQAEHERVREAALRAYRNNELREAKFQLEKAAQRERERLALEEEQARLAAQVIELQKKKIAIPTPPPREPTPPLLVPPATSSVLREAGPSQLTPQDSQKPSRPVQNGIPSPLQRSNAPSTLMTTTPSHQQAASTPHQPSTTPLQPPPAKNALQFPSGQKGGAPSAPALPKAASQATLTPARTTATKSSHNAIFSEAERYLEIHKKLKELRKFMVEAGKKDPQLKKKIGEMRREIRKSVGQITETKSKNKVPMANIVKVLKEALYEFPSPPLDPRLIMVNPPSQPEPNAKNTGDSLPTLYIYLLNIFAKAIVAQFIDEAGVSPKAADPIGVIAVSIYAQEDLLWRGRPLIDILLCKMRIACPVVFGIRGSEKTEEGRARLGWKKDDAGRWAPEQVHTTRMTGLGAGYAAISLRDFSKSHLGNPYPPCNYWHSFAAIVDTPPEEASPTQYTVLKAMIENFEQAFMKFYGDMARAALQYALVDFPAHSLEKSVAVSALEVLGDKLRRDKGLKLKALPKAPVSNPFGTFRR